MNKNILINICNKILVKNFFFIIKLYNGLLKLKDIRNMPIKIVTQ